MGNRAKLIIALLVGVATILAVAAYVLSQYPQVPLRHPAAISAQQHPSVPVVVAKTLLPAGKVISADDLEVLPYPSQPSGAFSQAAQLIGKTPAVNIAPQVPVLQQNLISGLATQIRPGHVAMAIQANPVLAVGYHLHPGDWVDVFGILPGNQQSGGPGGWPTQSRLLLPHLRVLAVGPVTVSHAQPVSEKKGEAQNSAGATQNAPQTLVLQVPLASANALALASEQGRLLLALQNPQNPTAPDTSAFPTPPPALSPSKLPYDQQQQALAQPANRAYAGETLPGLAGQGEPSAAVQHRFVRAPAPTVQVIAGGKMSRIPY